MPEPTTRPTRLAFVVIPVAIAPLILAFFPAEKAMFFVILLSIAIAAPAAGFWFGEMRGETGPGRAGLGCLSTLVLFALYMTWFLVIAPRLR